MSHLNQHSIQFGYKEIVFELHYRERKTLGITVRPDKSIIVHAPTGASYERILELMRKRAPWILKQQSYFLSFEPLTPERKYISGETHFYMGRQYRLKIYDSDENKVKLTRGFIEVSTTDRTRTKQLVQSWYKKQAETKMPDIAAVWIERFKKYGVEPSQILVKQMDLRWGSCTPKGKVILNTELIKAPKRCIEYVIVHELCHLIHHNHSSVFFELQTKEMPDWSKWKERLEQILS